MKDHELFYALEHLPSGNLLGFSVDSNDEADFCVSVAFTLDYIENSVWLVKNRNRAEQVRISKGAWFNASYDSPINPYKPKELRVVSVKISRGESDGD